MRDNNKKSAIVREPKQRPLKNYDRNSAVIFDEELFGMPALLVSNFCKGIGDWYCGYVIVPVGHVLHNVRADQCFTMPEKLAYKLADLPEGVTLAGDLPSVLCEHAHNGWALGFDTMSCFGSSVDGSEARLRLEAFARALSLME